MKSQFYINFCRERARRFTLPSAYGTTEANLMASQEILFLSVKASVRSDACHPHGKSYARKRKKYTRHGDV